MPLHPRTKNILEKHGLSYNITMVPPIGYFDMLELLKNCFLVITDSGGLQKEAFFNKKHSIIAREESEWVELIKNGFAKIVGSDKDKMLDVFRVMKEWITKFKTDFSKNLYGKNVIELMYKEIKAIL